MIELGLGLLNGPLALPGMLIARRLLCLSEDALARREAALAPAPLSKPAWMVLRLLGPGFFLRPPLALREPLVDGEELRVRRKEETPGVVVVVAIHGHTEEARAGQHTGSMRAAHPPTCPAVTKRRVTTGTRARRQSPPGGPTTTSTWVC